MKKTFRLLIPALALAAVPLPAGAEKAKDKPKCGAEASACIRDMAAQMRQRGWIGIEWHNEEGRPKLTHVVAGSPADQAGARVDDVVLAFNKVDTSQGHEVVYAEVKRTLIPGKVITLTVERAGTRHELKVELVAVPEHIVAQWVGMHVLEHHAAPPQPASDG